MRFEQCVWSEETSKLPRKSSALPLGNLLSRRVGRTCASLSERWASPLASPHWPSSRSLSASAPTPPSSQSEMECCCDRCHSRKRTDCSSFHWHREVDPFTGNPGFQIATTSRFAITTRCLRTLRHLQQEIR